jgi:hypothetical protein
LNENIEEQKKLSLVTSQKAVAISGTGATVITEQQKAEAKIKDLKTEQLAILEQILPIKEDDKRLTESINKNITEGARFTEDTTEKIKEKNIEAEKITSIQEEEIANLKFINNLKKESGKKFIDLSKGLGGNETPVKDIPLDINFIPEEVNLELGIIEKLQSQIKSINSLRDVATDPSRIMAYNEQLKSLQAQLGEFTSIQDPLIERNKIMLDSFSALGIGIAASLDIGNKAFKGFVTTVLSAAPKIIQALIAQSAAKKAASAKDIATNAQVAASEGIAVAAKGANALGPVGLALLPVFIGGALALISGAFSKIGGGGKISGGGGGGSMATGAGSGKKPQLFTNAFAPTIPNSSSPTPSGSIDFDRAQGRLSATVTGEDISFVYDRFQERKNGGG